MGLELHHLSFSVATLYAVCILGYEQRDDRKDLGAVLCKPSGLQRRILPFKVNLANSSAGPIE